MNSKSLKIIISLLFLSFVLGGCAQTTAKGKKKKVFQHDTPLIKEDVKKLGKIEVEKSAEMGPKPVEGDIKVLEKRKQISSVKEKNYLLIPDEYTFLKQNVSFKFQNLDYKEAMGLMAKIGEVNILVGEEVASTINASINTCLVLTSISLITLSTTSKSFALPLTIIDLVVFSSVTCIGE